MSDAAQRTSDDGEDEGVGQVVRKKWDEHYGEEEDTKLISSDGMTFKTHARHLWSSSSVLRDMMSGQKTTQPLELSFSDPDIETAAAITAVIELLVDQADIFNLAIYNDTILAHLISVVKFLQKYEMERELRIARLQLREAIRAERSVMAIFVVAASLDDHDLCGQAIEKAGSWKWTSEETGKFGESLKSGRCFDISTMSLDRLNLLPTDTVWALARASRKNSLFENSAEKYKAMGEEYVRLMKSRDQRQK